MASKPLSLRDRIVAFLGTELFPVTRDGKTLAGTVDALARYAAPLVPIALEVQAIADAAAESAATAQEIAAQVGDLAGAAAAAATQAGIATDKAGVAMEKAMEAAGSASAALAAEQAAELARDASLIQAGVAVDEPTGRAAAADGQAFKVQGSGDIAAYEYRRINSAASVLITAYPSAEGVQAFEITIAARLIDTQTVVAAAIAFS
ncbi:hypothetical protein [Cupriavidus basilensis]|uniref:hypothetical protein n=1 Tax=Cupriavidus basilensis TaxID=68895 RepID=UPI0039F71450